MFSAFISFTSKFGISHTPTGLIAITIYISAEYLLAGLLSVL